MQRDLLEGLLQTLGPDSEQAGQAYRTLHSRLARLFRLNRAADPEALADEAMDRLARRVALADREKIGSPEAFARGIAHHLLQEEVRRRLREDKVAVDWTSLRPVSDAQQEILLEAVDQCLGRMRADQQKLLRSYYQSKGRTKIEQHRGLAEELGLTLNAMRNRLMRARRELDTCVRLRSRDVSAPRRTKP